MSVRREKKHKKYRGHRTYHGTHKKWRGGGSRGGRGKAGLHKHKWSYAVKYAPQHFGKRGFMRPVAATKKSKSINVQQLEKISGKLLQKKIAEQEGEAIKINLRKIGYEKVLGGGKINRPIIVEAKHFSKSAAKKIEEAGGKAVVV